MRIFVPWNNATAAFFALLNLLPLKHLYALLCLLPLFASAQTLHNVTVGGSTAGGPLPFYNPQNLTIDQGDIVRWTNTTGTHNVNGSTTIFPANPESFSSGSVQSGSWSFQFTFTIAGVYNYHCTQQGHSATQFGTITVVNTTSVAESVAPGALELYPVPTADHLTVELEGGSIAQVEILALDGRLVNTFSGDMQALAHVNVGGLGAGQYLARITSLDGNITSRRFVKL